MCLGTKKSGYYPAEQTLVRSAGYIASDHPVWPTCLYRQDDRVRAHALYSDRSALFRMPECVLCEDH